MYTKFTGFIRLQIKEYKNPPTPAELTNLAFSYMYMAV